MVSPRKRLLQTNAENRPKTQLDRIRNRVIPGYKIYLDLRNPPLHLVEDLKFFGAVSSKYVRQLYDNFGELWGCIKGLKFCVSLAGIGIAIKVTRFYLR